MFLSVVIPVYNESESLPELHRQLDLVSHNHGYHMEIIFVDDGSSDPSWDIIKNLASRDARIHGIRFRRNFGKAAALNAGFAATHGDYVMTLDADLQDDPAEIPHFLAKMDDGCDVVSGWKKIRHDPWHKVGPSRIFNAMVSWLTGVKLHDHNCGMKCYRAEVLREVTLYGELHRFVPVLAAARGYRVGELVVQHRARQFGVSKYGVSRFIKGFLDLLTVKFITGFGQRPQHILGSLGLGAFFTGLAGMFLIMCCWLGSRMIGMEIPFSVKEHPAMALFSMTLLILGGQFLSVGFIAELITSFHQRNVQNYSVKDLFHAGDLSADSDTRTASGSGARMPVSDVESSCSGAFCELNDTVPLTSSVPPLVPDDEIHS